MSYTARPVDGQGDTAQAPTRGYVPWIGACALGEAVGLVAAGALNAILAPRLALAGAEPWVLSGLMLAAGAIEGAYFGLAQWLVLRTRFPGVGAGRWALATALGFVGSWTVGALASQLETGGDPSSGVVIAVALATGLVLGLGVGLAQAMVLWRHVASPGRWVALNAAGWMLGMVVSFLGARILPPGPYDLTSLLVGLATGAGVGITVGAVTGVAVRR